MKKWTSKKSIHFTKGEVSVFEPMVVYNEIVIDGEVFTIKGCTLIEADFEIESLPYKGTLCQNGMPIAECHNGGYGAKTIMTPLIPYGQYKNVMDKIEMCLWTAPRFTYKAPLTIDFVVDFLASMEWQRKTYLE